MKKAQKTSNLNFKTSHRKAIQQRKHTEQYQSIPPLLAQNRIKKIIEKNNQPSQETIKQIIIKNKLSQEPRAERFI